MHTFVHEDSQLEISPLFRLQRMQLTEERVMWSNRNDENTSRAAVFITD